MNNNKKELCHRVLWTIECVMMDGTIEVINVTKSYNRLWGYIAMEILHNPNVDVMRVIRMNGRNVTCDCGSIWDDMWSRRLGNKFSAYMVEFTDFNPNYRRPIKFEYRVNNASNYMDAIEYIFAKYPRAAITCVRGEM